MKSLNFASDRREDHFPSFCLMSQGSLSPPGPSPCMLVVLAFRTKAPPQVRRAQSTSRTTAASHRHEDTAVVCRLLRREDGSLRTAFTYTPQNVQFMPLSLEARTLPLTQVISAPSSGSTHAALWGTDVRRQQWVPAQCHGLERKPKADSPSLFRAAALGL